MTPMLIAAGLGCAGAVGVLLIAASYSRSRPRLAVRVRQGAGTYSASAASGGGLQVLGGWALRVVELLGSTSSSVQRRLQLLGRPGQLGAFRLAQFVAAVCGVVLASLLSSLFIAAGKAGPLIFLPLVIIGGLGAAALWDQVLTMRATRRQRAIDAQVPDASELLALAIAAGESVPGALDRVASIASSELAEEVAITVSDIQLGSPTSKVVAELSARNDSPNLDRLCQTLITAIERGSPLAEVLHDQARDIRDASRKKLMEEGGRREILMLVPVVLLILPITVIFALYPGLMSLNIGP